jgi:hypothetical protein
MLDLTRCLECGAPAEIADRFPVDSTAGPVELVKTFCAGERRHILTFDAARLAVASAVPEGTSPNL